MSKATLAWHWTNGETLRNGDALPALAHVLTFLALLAMFWLIGIVLPRGYDATARCQQAGWTGARVTWALDARCWIREGARWRYGSVPDDSNWRRARWLKHSPAST